MAKKKTIHRETPKQESDPSIAAHEALAGRATICLDIDLAIRWFTPAMQQVIQLSETDKGRPLKELHFGFTDGDLVASAAQVLKELTPIEDEAACQDGRCFIRRFYPYRTDDHRIGGVMITFLDITQRRNDSKSMRQSLHLLDAQLRASHKFHELSAKLVSGIDSPQVFDDVLKLAAGLMNADCASMQVIEHSRDEVEDAPYLRLVAHRGFQTKSITYWEVVKFASGSVCGQVLRSGERAVVQDVEACDRFSKGDLEAFRQSNIRAVQTTPLRSIDGKLLGVISTHWNRVYAPTPQQLAAFDVVAYQLGSLLERAKVARDLHHAKEFAESIVETLHEPLLVLNADLTIRKCNPAFYRDFQVSRDDTEGRKIYDLGNEQWNIPKLRDLLENVLPDSKVFEDYEVTHEFETIGRRTMLLNARRLDHVQLILLGIRDITERKRSEIDLAELNLTLEQQVKQRTRTLKLLQDVTRNANEAHNVETAARAVLTRVAQYNGWQVGHVWQVAEDGSGDMVATNIWYVSENAKRAIGRLDEFQRITAQTRFSPGQPLIGAVAQAGKAVWIDDIAKFSGWLRGDAKSMDLHAAIAFPVTVNGTVVAVLEFFCDHAASRDEPFMEIMGDVGIQLGYVFKRQWAERSLYESEERRRAVLNAAPDAIISTDSRGVIVDANPAARGIFGYRTEELLGRNVSMLMPFPYCQEHDGYIARYVQTKKARIIGISREVVGRRKDGRVVPIRINVNEVASLGLFVGIVHDISLEKELEKQVVDAAAEEQRRIAGDIHDGVGQELTGLRYMAQTHTETLAAQSSAETETARRMVDWLETVQKQLRHIIRELVPVEIDAHGLATALRGLAERTSEIHDLECTCECDPGLTVTDAALATHVFRIAQEAVRNAVKHANASQIRIQLMEQNHALRLQIEDDGVGIDPKSKTNCGFGLRSMAYRAGLVGANFTCRAREEGGTQVTCTMLQGEVIGNEWRTPETDDLQDRT